MTHTVHELTHLEREHARQLVQMGLDEDLAEGGDVTSEALLDTSGRGAAVVVARRAGVVAGLPVAEMVFRALDAQVDWQVHRPDGSAVQPGERLAVVEGTVRTLLAAERTALNFLCHLSGIATQTRQFVDAVAGTGARIYDTRKTLPGWRTLEKYAVRAGGGKNHRVSLGDAVLIKDNHLAALAAEQPSAGKADVFALALRRAKSHAAAMPIIVEVDDLDALRVVLPFGPDVVLLDNMPPATLAEAVRVRNATAENVLLEASGGITLANIRAIAETGVERISIGALTHSAPALDIALDWPGMKSGRL